jgi:hypothetical protein
VEAPPEAVLLKNSKKLMIFAFFHSSHFFVKIFHPENKNRIVVGNFYGGSFDDKTTHYMALRKVDEILLFSKNFELVLFSSCSFFSNLFKTIEIRGQ